jgi:4,5-dihydroxyphthalate decarboxylase
MAVAAVEPEPVLLRSLLDTYGYTIGLKDGSVSSPRVRFDFDEIRPIFDGFPRTIGTAEFQLSELSTATFLQAHTYGTPLLLLPVGLLNRFHHGSIVHNTDLGMRGPADLVGRRIAVRAYTQTTAVWVRGILQTEYGIDPDSITWVTFEDGHVQDFEEPPNVVRAPEGRTLDSMLLDGEVDAAIVGRDRPADRRVRDLIDDAESTGLDWYRRTGVLPINHMLVIRREAVEARPWIVSELASLLFECRIAYLRGLRETTSVDTLERDDRFRYGLLEQGIDPVPFGLAAVRPALDKIAEFCALQGLTPRRYGVDELFDPAVVEQFETPMAEAAGRA